MKTYVILRRAGWRAVEDVKELAERSTVEEDPLADDVHWLRSYVLSGPQGSVGTVCVYEATSPEAIRAHADRAGLPVDEIFGVVDTVVVRPDPAPVEA